jgi:hypothetical protein
MSDDTPTRPTPRSLLNAVAHDTAASAVVPVAPDDALDVVAGKVRAAGASHVQLLIPAGAAAFRSPRGFRALRVALGGRGIQVSVVSADPATLAAAREADVDTLGLDASTGTTRIAQAPSVARPVNADDEAFLRELDQVGGETLPALGGTEAELDIALDDAPDYQPPAPAPRPPRPLPEAAMRRLSGDTSPELARPRPRPRPERVSQSSYVDAEPPAAIPAPRPRTRSSPQEEIYDVAPRRRTVSPNLIAFLVIAALLTAAVLWALTNRVTVILTPPAGATRQEPFANEIIPLSRAASAGTATAVQALPVAAEAEYTLTSQVSTETVSPVGRARGQVRIVNTIEQPVPLPEGTEFVGQNAENAEVRFVIDQATTVPPAVTTSSESGRNTTYGETTVSITARSPGSASNVGANAIKQVFIPGQPPLVSDRSNFLLRHEAIGGGSEEPQRIVTEAEVERVLGEALTNLYNTGLQALEAEAAAQGLAVDQSTVAPNIAGLSQPESYDAPVVNPPVGTVVDANNPSFTVTVRTRFNALAAPADRPVAKQLETVVPQYFSQRASPPCSAGESQAVKDVSWGWNGERLAIEGVVECTPLSSVPPERVAAIRAALVGQSGEAAAATLDQYRQQGVIGGYQLPDRAELPPFELLIDVQVAEPR